MMNKKGVMLEFLVGVILAILIFTPTCLFLAKVFRTSQQAEDNFTGFVQEINELSSVQKGEDTIRVSVLILDPQTTLVYFEPGKETVLKARSYTEEFSEIYFARPLTCPENAHCLCLFQKYATEDYEVEDSAAENTLRVRAENPSCALLPLRLHLSVKDDVEHSCSLGVPESADGKYSCSQGFVIERGMVKEIGSKAGWGPSEYGYRQNERRIPINLLKSPSENSITLTSAIPELLSKGGKENEK